MTISKKLGLVILTFTAINLLGCKSTIDDQGEISTATANAALTETYWRLAELDGLPVKMADKQARESHMILHNKDNRIAGFSGCNHFFGQFVQVEQSGRTGILEFNTIAATQMACPDLNQDEQTFLKVFRKRIVYELSEQILLIRDEDNKLLAEFNAVYF